MGNQNRPPDRLAVLRGSQQPRNDVERPQTRLQEGRLKLGVSRGAVAETAMEKLGLWSRPFFSKVWILWRLTGGLAWTRTNSFLKFSPPRLSCVRNFVRVVEW